jgi:hypothetical protein
MLRGMSRGYPRYPLRVPARSRLALGLAAMLIVTATVFASVVLVPVWRAERAEAAIGDQLLPNLKALPAREFSVVVDAQGATQLRFSTISWNAGTGPLTLVAGTADSTTNRQDVWQWIQLEGGGEAKRLAGTFVWHPLHSHFHFEGYALYTLQPALATGAASRTSQKTTFCVMDTNRIDGTLPGSPSSGGYTTCGSSTQGLSIGWGDRYGYSLAGQSIDITGMADGDYKLFLDVDPQNKLTEASEGDNQSCVLLRIGVAAKTVQVLNANACDAVVAPTVTSITPSQARVGTSVAVTIVGTGFTSGVAVSFGGGNGAAPSLRNVVVVDATTITATVSVQRKRVGSDPVWDLRVGSATLPNAFTVTA